MILILSYIKKRKNYHMRSNSLDKRDKTNVGILTTIKQNYKS